MNILRIGVIGAGIVGLTTALELQKEFRNADITIIADEFYENTTSYVAAGIFRPGTSFCGANEEITREWIRNSYEYWKELCYSSNIGRKAGITEVSGYIFSTNHPHIVRNKFLEDLVPIYRKATQDELTLCNGSFKYGSFFQTLLIECHLTLPWMLENFKRNGGKIQERKIEDFHQLKEFDLIVNCTGLGSKYLCNDSKLVPIRGQILKVRAPYIKQFYYADFDTYIIPGIDSVSLGGCKQYDSYNLEWNKYDSQAIHERCTTFLPELKNAPILRELVGLRPHRDPVRVEREVIGNVRIVHNYGHGSYGVTSAPGTAKHTVRLVKDCLYCKL